MKERLIETAKYFFISTALINGTMFVCGTAFAPEQRFGYEILIYPLIYGFLACIPSLVMFTSRELTVKQTLIRKAVQLVIIVGIIEMVVFGGQFAGYGAEAVAVAACVVLVYAAAVLIRYKLDVKTARQMADQLKALQESVESAE